MTCASCGRKSEVYVSNSDPLCSRCREKTQGSSRVSVEVVDSGAARGMYNLTKNQKEILKWIVENVRQSNLDEEFAFTPTLSGSLVFQYGCKRGFSYLPNLSIGSMKALMESGLLIAEANDGTVHCTLLGKAYQAIDSCFDETTEKKYMFGSPDPKYTYDVFVLMPFTQELRPIYDDHIKETIKNLNLSVARADDFFSNNSIMNEIWSAIFYAKIIVADCTGKNPNVFYEIGIAHAINKPVILMTQDQNDVPFDLRHIRYIHYNNTPRGMKKFEETLYNTVSGIIEI